MSGFQRRSLAGKDKDGTLRGGPEHYSAAGLLERLRRYAPHAREAAARAPAAWNALMERQKEEQDLPLGERRLRDYGYTQERKLMQVFGLGLELPTSHHPTLHRTFPSLLQWVRDALAYVVELEGLAETNERAIAEALESHKTSESVRIKQRGVIDELRRGLEELGGQVADLRGGIVEERARHESEARDLRRDLAAAIETHDAWKLSAQTNALAVAALRRHGVIDMEVVDDGPQLPVVRHG